MPNKCEVLSSSKFMNLYPYSERIFCASIIASYRDFTTNTGFFLYNSLCFVSIDISYPLYSLSIFCIKTILFLLMFVTLLIYLHFRWNFSFDILSCDLSVRDSDFVILDLPSSRLTDFTVSLIISGTKSSQLFTFAFC